MEPIKPRSRREKIKFLNDIQAGRIKILEPIEDMIIIHNNERYSMKTGRSWIEENPQTPGKNNIKNEGKSQF